MALSRSFWTCAAAIVALVTAAACGGDDDVPPYSPPPDAALPVPDATAPDAKPRDTTPPTLKAHLPAAGDDNVWAGAPITLVFDEALAPASVDDAAVTLQTAAGPVAKRTILSGDGREIRVVIESPHIGPAQVTVTVANTVTDLAGNAFAGMTWSFGVPLWQRPGGSVAASGTGPLRPSLALDSSENPVIAWQDGTVIRASRFSEGQWQPLGGGFLNVASDGVASLPRIAVTSSDEPIVAWQESSGVSHVYAARFFNGAWLLMGSGPVDVGAGSEAAEPVLLIDEEDRPIVAWIEDKTRVEIRRWEGNAWRTPFTAWQAGMAIADLALALDRNYPVLAVAAKGARSSDVRVTRWRIGGTGWDPVGGALDRALDAAATRPSLAVSRDGLIGVAWQENDGFSDNVYAAEYDEIADEWHAWGKALDVEFDAPAVAPSIDFSREGTAVVAWSEEHVEGARTYVGRFNGKLWDVPGAGLDPEGSRSSTSAALRFDDAGNPVLVWEAHREAAGGTIAEVQTRRYNGGTALPFGLSERHAPPCAFPLDGEADFPRTLSDTKCFTDVPKRIPAPGLIPYDVNSALWSDGALKRRFIILPQDGLIGFDDKFAWKLPVGVILVKEFLFEREPGNPATIFPMETRFLVKRCESGACRAAWDGYAYQWNEAGTEATLLDNTNETVFRDWAAGGSTHRHGYPGRDECRQCHANVAGGVLGLQTAQMNRNFDYGGVVDNQLRAMVHAGLFDTGASTDGGAPEGGASEDGGAPEGGAPPGDEFPFGALDTLRRLPTPGDAAYSVNERVRSYFHSNCSHCHRPDGRWPVINFLYDAPLIPVGPQRTANICDELVPGDAESSRIYIKDSARLGSLPPDFFGLPMPPLATLLPDKRQLPTLKRWINEMRSCP